MQRSANPKEACGTSHSIPRTITSDGSPSDCFILPMIALREVRRLLIIRREDLIRFLLRSRISPERRETITSAHYTEKTDA